VSDEFTASHRAEAALIGSHDRTKRVSLFPQTCDDLIRPIVCCGRRYDDLVRPAFERYRNQAYSSKDYPASR
jgi:hypothetical protein